MHHASNCTTLISELIPVSSHFRLSSLNGFVCMINRISPRFHSQEFSHFKDRIGLRGLILRIKLLLCVNKLVRHSRSPCMSPRRIHQSLSIYFIHFIQLSFTLLMLITRKFAIEIAKYSFNRSAWSQRQSIRVII